MIKQVILTEEEYAKLKKAADAIGKGPEDWFLDNLIEVARECLKKKPRNRDFPERFIAYLERSRGRILKKP